MKQVNIRGGEKRGEEMMIKYQLFVMCLTESMQLGIKSVALMCAQWLICIKCSIYSSYSYYQESHSHWILCAKVTWVGDAESHGRCKEPGKKRSGVQAVVWAQSSRHS